MNFRIRFNFYMKYKFSLFIYKNIKLFRFKITTFEYLNKKLIKIA